MLRFVFKLLFWVPVVAILYHTVVRIVRHFYKFPMPQALANLIDNPLRRRFQPPDETAVRHGLKSGMIVLDVGPGNGTYTVAAARRVGKGGCVFAIDIEPKMVERVQQRALAERVNNLEARVADVYDLPFEDGFFDAATMIAVIGEIPEPVRAMREIYRVLSPVGTLVLSELFVDPDYMRASALQRKAGAAGFRLKERVGGFFYYTLIFEKNEGAIT